MTIARDDRRARERRSGTWWPFTVDERKAERRISGTADRRREIDEELAALYRRRSGECTPTCIHTQDAAS